jgi:hypothetical protein
MRGGKGLRLLSEAKSQLEHLISRAESEMAVVDRWQVISGPMLGVQARRPLAGVG